MAYLKKDSSVFIANNGKPITALIKKVAFRKYLANVKDKETGKKVRKRKSMPFAVCEVKVSMDPTIPLGSEFLIAGYKLCHAVVQGERILTFHTTYATEFANEYGNDWVRKLIMEEGV